MMRRLRFIIYRMFNFASMFSGGRGSSGNSVSELLATPNVSLMRLLDEEAFLSDFRAGSYPIKDYMTYKKFLQLVELVTQVGDPFDKKRSYKFPLTAADLLASETPFVLEKLLPEEGVIVEEEKVVASEEREVEQEVDDDDEEETVPEEGKEETKEERAAGEEEEQFGEFVSAPATRKKTIKVKEVVETVSIVKHSYPPLVANILDYFGSDINYTLTSYCCRILTSLLNKRTARFLAKFFEEPTSAANLLKHIGSRSTVELVTRILTIETTDCLDQRLAFFKELLQQASIPHELEAISNISAALCETFEKLTAHLKTSAPCRELQAYFSIIPELLLLTVDNIIAEHEVVSVYSAPFIFQLLNCLPAELDNSTIDEMLGRFVEGAVGKLEKAVAERKGRLGVGRVKMIEVLNFVMRREKIRELLSQRKGFFPLLFSLIRAYPLNNILHNEAFKLISSSTTSETVPLAESLFEGDSLIQWLSEEAEQEGQRGQQSPGKSPRGYAGHLVNLCKLIRDPTAPATCRVKQDQRFQDVLKVLVDKVVVSHERTLGGYAMRKNGKFPIMFTKEEILKQHAAFLENARPAVFETDPENPLLNQALLEQLQRQLDGVEITNLDKPEEVVEEEKHKAELIEENEQHKSAFWKVHLDYDVDDLLHELQ